MEELPNETQSGVRRVKIHKVRGTNSPIKYSACLLFFYLSSALVKAEREVLLPLTIFTYSSR